MSCNSSAIIVWFRFKGFNSQATSLPFTIIKIIMPFEKKAIRRSDLQQVTDENCYQFNNQFHQEI